MFNEISKVNYWSLIIKEVDINNDKFFFVISYYAISYSPVARYLGLVKISNNNNIDNNFEKIKDFLEIKNLNLKNIFHLETIGVFSDGK